MNIIDYIVKNKGLKQQDIAKMLNVSKAQVSKWKAGEYISYAKQEELNKIAGLFGDDTEWAIMAKTKKNAQAWYKYFAFMEKSGMDGYDTQDFSEEDNAQISVPSLLKTLKELGVKIPESAPAIPNYESDDEYEETAFDVLISQFMTNYGYLVHWWEHFTDWLIDTELFEEIENIKWGISSIALSHIDEKIRLKAGISDKKFETFIQKEQNSLIKNISNLCLGIVKLGYPITVDYFKITSQNPYELDDEVIFGELTASIGDFISIGERKIAEEVCELKQQIKELHEKIDKLLGQSK